MMIYVPRTRPRGWYAQPGFLDEQVRAREAQVCTDILLSSLQLLQHEAVVQLLLTTPQEMESGSEVTSDPEEEFDSADEPDPEPDLKPVDAPDEPAPGPNAIAMPIRSGFGQRGLKPPAINVSAANSFSPGAREPATPWTPSAETLESRKRGDGYSTQYNEVMRKKSWRPGGQEGPRASILGRAGVTSRSWQSAWACGRQRWPQSQPQSKFHGNCLLTRSDNGGRRDCGCVAR